MSARNKGSNIFKKIKKHHIIIGILLAILSLIAAFWQPIGQLFAKPDYAISSKVCTTLKTISSNLTTESGKQLDINIRALNYGYVYIENTGSKELNNFESYVSLESNHNYKLLYLDVFTSSRGAAAGIEREELKTNPVTLNLVVKYLNPGESILIQLGVDKPADANIETRGVGFTQTSKAYPGCKGFPSLEGLMKKITTKLDSPSYTSDECIREMGYVTKCELTYESESFSVPGDVRPGGSLQENTSIDEDELPK